MLSEYCEHSDSKMYLSAITADFDRLFELCWKTLKEYLDKEKGMREAKSGSPKDIIKLAYHQEMIIPDDFLKACDMSGMYYDEFVAKIMKENDLKSDLELFQKW